MFDLTQTANALTASGMNAEESINLAKFAKSLHDEMQRSPSVRFAFIKKDGTARVAHGTLMTNAVEAAGATPKGAGKTPNHSVLVYFDVDKQQWRSCRIASLTHLR